MRPAPYQHQSYAQRTPAGRRIAAFVVALAVNLLLLAVLLRIGPSLPDFSAARPGGAIFDLLPDQPKRQARAARRASAAPTRPPRAQPVRRPATSAAPLAMVTLTPEEFAASDISRLPSHPEDRRSAAADGEGQQGDSRASGGGPNGEKLYGVEWYRRPTDAELAFYMPTRRTAGWALIACRSVEKFHVDDCREIADSPPGSGLASAMRRAAWQFLVRPPRVGGRPLIGAWVGICFDFSTDRADDGDEPVPGLAPSPCSKYRH